MYVNTLTFARSFIPYLTYFHAHKYYRFKESINIWFNYFFLLFVENIYLQTRKIQNKNNNSP